MELGIIIAIIVLGLLIIMVEIFLIPGTTIVGILGALVVLIGVAFGYSELGKTKGHLILLGSLLSTGILLYFGFKAYTSQRFALKERIDSKVNVLNEHVPAVGEEGVTITSLRPSGKVKINHRMWEAYSIDEFIEPDVPVIVTKIEQNKIFVKPIKTTQS
jgi:membrane-bound ClpP family serine protease